MIITDKVIENHINTIIDLVKEIETNKVTVLVGQNGTGKSLIRKQMGVRFYKEYGDNKSHTRTVSMQVRTESRPEFDALCTCMHDMPDEPTSLASYSLVESVMNYDMKNINDYFLIFDELEVGMSEESILGMVEYLNKNILSWLENSLGILIITHSKVLASGIMKSFDANFINLGYNTVSYDFNEWLNRKLEPADFNFLREWSSKLYHAVSARSKSIKNNNEKGDRVMKTALVIVDMQEGFINDYTYDLTSKIRNFVDNNDFDLIIGTKYINHENTACYKYEGWKGCMRGTGEVSIVQELADVCDEVFEKDKYSCWNDDFIDILKSNEIDRLVFVGVNTGCCVLNSVFDAYNDLFDVVVIKDLCGSTSGVKSHKCAIQILEECITKERVITSSEYKIRGDLIVYNITE